MDGVIFDLDGTLVNSMWLWRRAGCIYLEEKGIKAEESLADELLLLTIGGAAAFIKNKFGLAEDVAVITAGINGVMEKGYKNTIPPKEGAEELLEALAARKIPMAVATATDRQLVKTVLSRFGWEKYFTGIFTCSEVGYSKRESAEVYLAALRSFGGSAENSWVFEDAPFAARTARAAGFNVAAVFDADGKAQKSKLKEVGTVYIESLAPSSGVLKLIGLE